VKAARRASLAPDSVRQVEGDVGVGDEVRVIYRPDHDLTIRDVFRIYTRDRDEVERLIAIPQMSDSWKQWATTRLQKSKGVDAKAPARHVVKFIVLTGQHRSCGEFR
jgi:hypothetical protein